MKPMQRQCLHVEAYNCTYGGSFVNDVTDQSFTYTGRTKYPFCCNKLPRHESRPWMMISYNNQHSWSSFNNITIVYMKSVDLSLDNATYVEGYIASQ